VRVEFHTQSVADAEVRNHQRDVRQYRNNPRPCEKPPLVKRIAPCFR
jgi:hypothetical protein